jgi:Cu/Ag efflux pump CusA
MENMFEELATAVLLTGLAVLLFLGNVRATVIALITLPMSMAISLLAMVPLGMTLNSSTLIGLLLSIGRLVDDSIIDVHSIERHLRMGKSPKEAAVDGIVEVQLAVLAIAFMLCVALLPLAFSGGIVQQMFEGIVWTMILAQLASAFVAFTLLRQPAPGPQRLQVCGLRDIGERLRVTREQFEADRVPRYYIPRDEAERANVIQMQAMTESRTWRPVARA